MSRMNRRWFQGAIFHVMSRGNGKKEIFREEDDYIQFLNLLKKYTKEFDTSLQAYCLMSNHYHLLLETGERSISDFMKELNHSYVRYFNRKYNLVGHLYQGRFKSCLIDDNSYFLQVSRYIHLNPVKAHIVECPEDYEWSSYKTMIGLENEEFMKLDRTYAFFQEPYQENYKKFVEASVRNEREVEIRESMGEDEMWMPR